ncbi:hypothetical protein DFP73DRAFT_601723 [Morchella snyderi]|nr:hypothetical protein DFP73DRAFT_601723 [Morchella snyderi]
MPQHRRTRRFMCAPVEVLLAGRAVGGAADGESEEVRGNVSTEKEGEAVEVAEVERDPELRADSDFGGGYGSEVKEVRVASVLWRVVRGIVIVGGVEWCFYGSVLKVELEVDYGGVENGLEPGETRCDRVRCQDIKVTTRSEVGDFGQLFGEGRGTGYLDILKGVFEKTEWNGSAAVLYKLARSKLSRMPMITLR